MTKGEAVNKWNRPAPNRSGHTIPQRSGHIACSAGWARAAWAPCSWPSRPPGTGGKGAFAADDDFATRFHSEVENARRVASFCTAQVLDNGTTDDGRPYMVTEYIAGTPLSRQISRYGALEAGPLHGVALGVAAALAAIHVAGLVHRDLPARWTSRTPPPRRASCSAAPAGGRPSRCAARRSARGLTCSPGAA